jgi:hypothetical protein
MFSAGNAKTDPQRVYARAGAMHAGFAQCAAFDQDAIDIGGVEKNSERKKTKIAMLCERSYDPLKDAVERR